MRWLWRHSQALPSLPDPREDQRAWFRLMADHPEGWRNIARKARWFESPADSVTLDPPTRAGNIEGQDVELHGAELGPLGV
eukprot:15272617-Alexandrium_andersonii.AAC.1